MFTKRNDPDDPNDRFGLLGLDVVWPDIDPAPISVVTLAGELGDTPDALAHRLGTDVFREDRTGLRCVTVETCRRVIDERDERRAAAAERHRQQVAAAAARSAAEADRRARFRPDPALADIALRGMQGRQA